MWRCPPTTPWSSYVIGKTITKTFGNSSNKTKTWKSLTYIVDQQSYWSPYKNDESARTAKNKLERLVAECGDYSITVSQPEAVRTSGTETEPSNLPAIKAVAAGPRTAETPSPSSAEKGTKALALFDRYRRAAGLRPRSITAAPEEPIMTTREEGLEEAVGLRIYSLSPCRQNPRTAVITYEDLRSTPTIQAIIRKEDPIKISVATMVRGPARISATFQTVDKCVCTIIKYMRWAATEEEDPRKRKETTPQPGPAMISPQLDENRNAPTSPEMTDHERWEARRVAEMEERKGKRLEHEAGLRINVIIRPPTAERTAILYFGRSGDIDYFFTLPISKKGVHQIFIKYFRIEITERALAEADPLYGVRRSNPSVVRDNIALLRYHPICRQNINKKHYKNHEKICRWQVGAETVIHYNCGRLVKRCDWSRHNRECNQFCYEGATTAPTCKTTPSPASCEREPECPQGELEEKLDDITLDYNSDDDYHPPDLSQEDDIRATKEDA